MPIAAELNKLQKMQVTYTLLGAPGSIDPSSPVTVTLDPATSGVAENIAVNADGSLVTFDLTTSVLGDTAIVVDSDSNLAAGVLPLKVNDVITTVDVLTLGADTGVIAAVPAV